MKRPNTLAEVARRVSAGAAFGPTLSEFLDEFHLHPKTKAAVETGEYATTSENDREHRSEQKPLHRHCLGRLRGVFSPV